MHGVGKMVCSMREGLNHRKVVSQVLEYPPVKHCRVSALLLFSSQRRRLVNLQTYWVRLSDKLAEHKHKAIEDFWRNGQMVGSIRLCHMTM